MFSRRHPYLFFLLIFSSISATVVIVLSLLLVFSLKKSEFEFGDKVGIIEIKGFIGESRLALQDLKRFRNDKSVKAIVVRIDSPGGVVGPSQEIYREIRKTIKSKKVITSMGAIAASGGYYIAAASDGIVASPGTLTGSIGVIIGYTNFQELLEKIGLVPVVIKSGKYKDLGSPARKMTAEEREILQSFAEQTHRQFIQAVAEGRNLEIGAVETLADGRIYSGEEAKNIGLVDRLGNLEDAIEWAGRLGGIEGKVSAVYAREKKRSIFKYLTESTIETLLNRTVDSRLFPGYLYTPPQQ